MRFLAKNSVVVIAARPMSPSADCTASDPSVLVRGCGDLAEDEASWEGKRSKLLFGVAAWSNSVVDLMTLIASLFSFGSSTINTYLSTLPSRRRYGVEGFATSWDSHRLRHRS